MSLSGQISGGPRAVKAKSDGRPQSNGDSERNLWSSMLDSVASGKKLPEKNLLILGLELELWVESKTDILIGGSPDTQKEFLDTLGSENIPKRTQDRYRKKPPIANEFALGYTYQDVLDADHEGRINDSAYEHYAKLQKTCLPAFLSISSRNLRPFSPLWSSHY